MYNCYESQYHKFVVCWLFYRNWNIGTTKAYDTTLYKPCFECYTCSYVHNVSRNVNYNFIKATADWTSAVGGLGSEGSRAARGDLYRWPDPLSQSSAIVPTAGMCRWTRCPRMSPTTACVGPPSPTTVSPASAVRSHRRQWKREEGTRQWSRRVYLEQVLLRSVQWTRLFFYYNSVTQHSSRTRPVSHQCFIYVPGLLCLLKYSVFVVQAKKKMSITFSTLKLFGWQWRTIGASIQILVK